MTMTSREQVEQILAALSEALRRSRRIGQVEADVGRSRGYFSKVAAGKWRISIDVLMHTLEVLEIDPVSFFAQALAEPIAPEPSIDPRSDSGPLRSVEGVRGPFLDPDDFGWNG